MQPLTAAPRQDMSAAQVLAVLTGTDQAARVAGLDVLDNQGNFLQDITADLVPAGSTVGRNNDATVHGVATLVLRRELPWGSVLLRPRLTVTRAAGSVSAYLGVLQPTAPQRTVRVSAMTVQCEDLLSWLNVEIGDGWEAPDGAVTVDEITRVILAAGVPASLVRVDRSNLAPVQSGGLQWPLQSGSPTFLEVANALAESIGYRGVYADPGTGVVRTEPYTDPAVRAPELTFTAGMVDRGAQIAGNLWDRPNWWRFVMQGLTLPPVEGDGFVTVTDPAGLALLGGRRVPKVSFVQAADQAALEASAARSVAADKAVTVTVSCMTGPMPLAGHEDVYMYDDAAALGKVKVRANSWTLPLDLGRMSHTWSVVS